MDQKKETHQNLISMSHARFSMMQETVERALGRATDPDHQRGAFHLVVSELVKQVTQANCARGRPAEVSHPSRSASGKNPSQRSEERRVGKECSIRGWRWR